MGIAWGLSQRSPSFAARDAELRARGMAPIQARSRSHPTLPTGAKRTMRVEHEYERRGALAY